MSLRWLPQDERSFPNTLQLSRVERLVREADSVLQKEDGPPVWQKGCDFFRQIFEGSDIEHGERRRRSRHLDGFLFSVFGNLLLVLTRPLPLARSIEIA